MQDFYKRVVTVLILTILLLGVKHVEAETTQWIWPSDGIITDSFGSRNGHHKGIDIAAPLGSNIYAVDRGVVSKSYYSDTYGNVVFIKHDNGYETVYAHLKERRVKKAQVVQQGDVIGIMGNTGHSTGVHLHFEVHRTEWTLDKRNAFNPTVVLGAANIGQPVMAAVYKDSEETVEKH